MLRRTKDRIVRVSDVLHFALKLFLKTSNAEKRVFMNLHNAQNGPYYFDLIKHFEAAGYAIYIKLNWHFIYARTDYFRTVLKSSNVKAFLFPNWQDGDMYCYDEQSEKETNVKQVFLEYNSFSKNVEFDVGFPFGISPVHFINDTIPDLDQLRKKKRSMRILFSGNTNQAMYDHDIYSQHFKMVNRYRAIQVLQKELSKEDLSVNESTMHPAKLNLKIWEWEPSSSKSLDQRIPNELWFETLASSDFFLGLPGFRMPLCYNLIESMAVGCIPILEYGEYFDPPLQDGINCISFSGEEGLIQKIKEANSMDPLQIERIKANVIHYYEEYHLYGKIIEEIEAEQGKDVLMRMYCGVQSINKLKSVL